MARTIVPVIPSGQFDRVLASLRSAGAKRRWGAEAGAGLPRRIRVTASSSATLLRLRVEYRFGRSHPECGSVLFDLASWPYQVYLPEAEAGPGMAIRGSVLRYPLVPSSDGTECLGQLEFGWEADAGAGTLRSLRQLLPEVVLLPSELVQAQLGLPELELTILPESSAATRVGITDSRESSTFATWILTHPPRQFQSVDGDAGCLIHTDESILRRLSFQRWGQVLDVLTRSAVATSRLLGTSIPEPILLCYRSNVDPETPGVVALSEDQLQGDEPYSLSYDSTRQIAALAWGGACRVHGRHHRELEEAICAAIAVRVADGVAGEERASAMGIRFRARAIRNAPVQLWQRLVGVKQHRVVFQLADQLLALSLERGAGLFAHVTRQCWKRSSRSDHVLQIARQYADMDEDALSV